MKAKATVRVASLQYAIKPVARFEDFAQQVQGWVEVAKDYKADLVLFPEYFSVQLLTLGNVRRPIAEQVRSLAELEPRILEVITRLAQQNQILIAAGTMPSLRASDSKIVNRCHLIGPGGVIGHQDKLHMTRFEDEEWLVSSGKGLQVFDTPLGKLAVAICYDVEFPELVRSAAHRGAQVLLVPSCTDDRHGFHRVRYCAHARAIENQMYVVHSGTVGSMPEVPTVALNYGQAAVLTPCDHLFARDGVLVQGEINEESCVVADINLDLIDRARESGTVLTLRDSKKTPSLLQ